MFGMQERVGLTGASTATAISFTCWVTKFARVGGCPTVNGHIRRSQRAIFPLIAVGPTKDFTKLLIASRDLNPVTVTLSVGVRAGCANAREGTMTAASAANRKPATDLPADVVGSLRPSLPSIL